MNGKKYLITTDDMNDNHEIGNGNQPHGFGHKRDDVVLYLVTERPITNKSNRKVACSHNSISNQDSSPHGNSWWPMKSWWDCGLYLQHDVVASICKCYCSQCIESTKDHCCCWLIWWQMIVWPLPRRKQGVSIMGRDGPCNCWVAAIYYMGPLWVPNWSSKTTTLLSTLAASNKHETNHRILLTHLSDMIAAANEIPAMELKFGSWAKNKCTDPNTRIQIESRFCK